MLNTNNFPQAVNHGHQKTSEIDPRYNCIAWSLGDTKRFWWPPGSVGSLVTHWPKDLPRVPTLEAFVALYSRHGYTECQSHEFETGKEKVALYALAGEPTHAARQLNGKWSSKLGKNIDISHDTLACLEGGLYGQVVKVFSRVLPAS
jgi:hypothetical protein